jgi:hypothetical protein
MNKKALIGQLYYNLSKQDPNFKLAIAWIDSNGDIHWSKWRTFLECCNDDTFLEKCNNRLILKTELILDIDCQTKEECNLKYDEIIKRLLEKNFRFKAYFTGSKGYHIHIHKKSWMYCSQRLREEEKGLLINYFGCDGMKAYDKAMIAMEECPHWKTGVIKRLIFENG